MDTILYQEPTYEPDEQKREKMMFHNPFQDPVIEGGSTNSNDAELASVVILSSN